MASTGARDVRITVVKKLNARDILDEELREISADVVRTEPECPLFQVGDAFVVSDPGAMPKDFPCAWAFSDIYRQIVHLGYGGSFPWVARKGEILVCCTDGVRPVIFKLEHIGPA